MEEVRFRGGTLPSQAMLTSGGMGERPLTQRLRTLKTSVTTPRPVVNRATERIFHNRYFRLRDTGPTQDLYLGTIAAPSLYAPPKGSTYRATRDR